MTRWHLSAWSASLAAGPNLDTAFVADGVLQQRNAHLILSDRFNLINAMGIGALITRSRFNNASMIYNGVPHIWPLNVSATIPTLPAFMDLRDRPWALPVDEELVVESSNSGAGPTVTSLFGWLATPDWDMTFPPHEDRFSARATVALAAGSASTWGALSTIVMERDLRGGVYCVVGAWMVCATALAFRMFFPRARAVNGRQMRPGGLVQETATLNPHVAQDAGFGEWGRFHTFELPQIQAFGANAGATFEVRLDLLRLGSSESLLDD